MKETFDQNMNEGVFHKICSDLSHKVSEWLRQSADEAIKSGRKVNVFLNYQVTEKVKLIKKVMNRIIYGLNKDAGGDVHVRGGKASPQENSAATLAKFISVVKETSQKPGVVPLKERVAMVFYRANDMSRAFYMNDETKNLFQRCMRLFFFF